MSRLPVERRKQPRQTVGVLVDLIASEVLLNHPLENLSPTGLSLQTECLEQVGTRVELVLRLPRRSATLPVRGEVIWVSHDPPRDMGIRFVDLDPERTRTLERILGLK
jgi:hypothetical protein